MAKETPVSYQKQIIIKKAENGSSHTKIGILIDSWILPAWAYLSIEKIIQLEFIEISLIIQNDKRDSLLSRTGSSLPDKSPKLFYILDKIDKAIFVRDSDAFAPVNTENLFSAIPVVKLSIDCTSEPSDKNIEEIEIIKTYDLDIIIGMGCKSLETAIAEAARFGVWSYDQDYISWNKGEFSHLWDIYNKCSETSLSLYNLNGDKGHEVILYRSYFQADPFSPARNRNRCYWASSSFLPRQLRLLNSLGEEKFYSEIMKYNPTAEMSHPKNGIPSSVQLLTIYANLFFRKIIDILQRFFYDGKWYVLFTLNKTSPISIEKFQKIPSPKDRFWADPHIIQLADKYYIFVEEYLLEQSWDGRYIRPFSTNIFPAGLAFLTSDTIGFRGWAVQWFDNNCLE